MIRWDSAPLLRGVEQLERAVGLTLGPKGRLVLLQRRGRPVFTKDGVTVAASVWSSDRLEMLGIKLVRDAARQTATDAGDGTTTTIVLAHAMTRLGFELVAAGADPLSLQRGMSLGVNLVTGHVREQSIPCEMVEQLASVAALAANGDPKLGAMIGHCLEKVGVAGVVTVSESGSYETRHYVYEGYKLPVHWQSHYFVTDAAREECVLRNPFVLLWGGEPIHRARDLLPLLDQVAETGRDLLIVGELKGDALQMLALNMAGHAHPFRWCVVQPPGFGQRRSDQLEDLATYLGGRALQGDADITLSTLEHLGQAQRVIVGKRSTLLLPPEGRGKAVLRRVRELRQLIKRTEDDYARGKLEERLARLTGSVAEIRVGGATASERKEARARVEDALQAARAASESGVVPGGGVALLKASQWAGSIPLPEMSHDELLGLELVLGACRYPLRRIAANAGADASYIEALTLEDGQAWNAQTGVWGHPIEQGVIDPTKVVLTALRNAASVAGLLLSKGAAILQ